MVMKIYGAATTNVERAILPLCEAEVDLDKEVKMVFVDIRKHEHKNPAYLAKQPFGLVPSFEDGDLVLTESRAIARYIAEKYQDQGVPLLGKTLKERAIINQWCEVESQNFDAAAAPLVREWYRNSVVENRPVNEEFVATYVAKLEPILDVYEAQLSRNKYIGGDKYSLADAFHIPVLNRLLARKKDIFTGRKHVLAWAETLISRPSYKKTQELHGHRI